MADVHQTKVPNWDESIASQVSFYDNSSDAVHGSSPASKYLLTFTSNQIQLYNAASGIVIDSIDVRDIIGADIEISVDDKNRDRSCQKAVFGRENMETLEEEIGKKLMNGFKHNTMTSDATQSQHDQGSSNRSGATAYINIYAYPRMPPPIGIIQRIKQCFLPNEEREQDHANCVSVGRRVERHRRYKLQPTEDLSAACALIQCIRHVAGLPVKKKRYFVLVNPFSGTKTGKETYETIVKKMLNESGLEHDVLVTKHKGHAVERMMKKDTDVVDCTEGSAERDISEYDGLIVMGGDGILSEVLQGLKTRSDYDEIMKQITFGIVGCGTSNGLAASILYAAKESYGQLESTFLICKGRTTRLDLSQYETVSKSYISFLTYSWGMIADIDIESEIIRFMGIIRNDIWAVWRLINLRSYKATFSYLPAGQISAGNQCPALHEDVPSQWVTLEGDFILLWASQVSHASTNTIQSPQSRLQDGIFNVLIVRKPCSRWNLLKILLGFEHGLHVGNEKVEYYQCVSFRLDPKTDDSYNDVDGEVVEPGRIQGLVMPAAMKFFV